MDDFVAFDPGVTPDLIPVRIMQLRRANSILTVIAIAAVITAIYFVSRCSVTDDEYKKVDV